MVRMGGEHAIMYAMLLLVLVLVGDASVNFTRREMGKERASEKERARRVCSDDETTRRRRGDREGRIECRKIGVKSNSQQRTAKNETSRCWLIRVGDTGKPTGPRRPRTPRKFHFNPIVSRDITR